MVRNSDGRWSIFSADKWSIHAFCPVMDTKKLRAEFNGFYRPFEFTGALAMFRYHYKVSGHEDTVYSCILPMEETK